MSDHLANLKSFSLIFEATKSIFNCSFFQLQVSFAIYPGFCFCFPQFGKQLQLIYAADVNDWHGPCF